ncbi:flagellar hook-associated protein FlgK [Rhizorhabdus dicambivorans]|uniref:Flagellar hook-associated protein 1 n=1 Tax=Rhizorhabdus dicambivorans TaxID=1850238 RepID=A0A2A4FUX5_9SPHN|nr:flagellar hook-associated protein FlgK [Rhizorhabdus dicambivorans]ATE64458.1 flagellar hook-associated protein FlgK [Rhizorhabdus dicambivorans]PCE41191.1 flagellar hook-associated protein FlgK [Rhizorhabdus dicambivorans]
MSDLLQIGRSGVIAYRAALSTVGENVSNAETEGYTRRKVNLTESAVASSSNYIYRSSAVFGGVEVGSVQRVFDNYRSTYARFANSEASKADAKAAWLDTAEGALDDSDVGLGVKMGAVFTSAEALSADVSSDTNRRTMLTAITDAANQFNTTAAALRSSAEGISTAAQNNVAKLNADLRTLTQINAGLRRSAPGSQGQALLLDQRDATLKSISNAVGIDVRLEDDGRAEVTLLGDNTVKLVDATNSNPGYVGLVQANSGRLSLVASGFGEEVPMAPQSGSLAGLVDAANTIASRRESLDAIASRFAQVVNDWNSAGIDRNGNPGAALVTGNSADTLGTATSDLSLIAAASTAGVANGNALALKDYRNSAGPEAQWALLVSTHAQSVAAAKAEQSATAIQRDGALQQLDEVTGVDLDVEAAQLLRFQQAYNGSARIIQIARETLQEILGLF